MVPNASTFNNADSLARAGLTVDTIVQGLKYTYETIDSLDATLLNKGTLCFSNLIELANLSSVIGNILGTGIAHSSSGAFERNGPHKFPDLLARKSTTSDIEIKVALETNKPKGHLAKRGFYLTCRYVLCDEVGGLINEGQGRGNTVWVWELRFGFLEEDCFNLSNTPGDSGKTAVINAKGMDNLAVIYCDLERCPYSKRGSTYRQYERLLKP
jgi:hypothetical protein